MNENETDKSLMEATGMGLLPGLVVALILIVFAMAALLTGSIWAVAIVLALIAIVTGVIVYVVVALTSDGDDGRRLRSKVPGLGD
jgi:hypothetical protein